MNAFMKLSPKGRWIHLLLYVNGIVFMPLGVILTITSKLGAGGYDALNFALAETFHCSVSVAIYSTAFLVILITALVRKERPRVVTFLSSFLLGLFTDVWQYVFQDVSCESVIWSYVLLAVGILIIAWAVTTYAISVLPCNPTDDLVVALTERGIKMGNAKSMLDVVCFVLAVLAGGQIGIGTIACTLGIGPIVNQFEKVLIGITSQFETI